MGKVLSSRACRPKEENQWEVEESMFCEHHFPKRIKRNGRVK